MEIVRAGPADVERLAELNKQLIKDERHPYLGNRGAYPTYRTGEAVRASVRRCAP